MTHGECVGIGMVGASYIAYKRNMIDESTLNRIENVLDMYGFKIRVDLPEKEVVYGYMQKDKKKIAGKLKFVDEGNGTYRIATIDDETTTDTLVSPEEGVITVKGLSEGDYVIEETKAPDGYAKLKNTINKTISVDGNAPQTVNVEEKVTNKTESWLPETGGMGTVIFTVVGVVGVLAILSTYFKKGKKREEA